MLKPRSTILSLFVLLLTFSLTQNRIIAVQGSQTYYFNEDRTLELVFIGISPNIVIEEYYQTLVNHTYPSEYPFGDPLSYLTIDLQFRYLSNSSRDQFANSLDSVSQYNEAEEAYFVLDDKFQSIITNEIVKKHLSITDSGSYYCLIINLAYDGSPFNYSNVYIDHSQPDLDTNEISLLRNVASYGVSFSLEESPVLGLITSSLPKSDIENYPYTQYLIDHQLSIYSWNEHLGSIINQAIWCRINPSPVFRFNAHKEVNLHYSLIYLNGNLTQYELLDYINTIRIENQIQKLLPISFLSSSLSLIQADENFISAINISTDQYNAWTDNLISILQTNSYQFWNTPYSTTDITQYDQPLDLFIAILVGEEHLLPYSSNNVGISHFVSSKSEFGGLSVITMNYQNLLGNHEGLTQTTIHEISHLLGIAHPHDYWDPITQNVVYSWIWSYSQTSLSYSISSYSHDYFDKQLVLREQIQSLLENMKEHDYQDPAIHQILTQIRLGNYLSLKTVLQQVEYIFQQYNDRLQFHHFFQNVILPTCIVTIIIGLISLILYKKKKS